MPHQQAEQGELVEADPTIGFDQGAHILLKRLVLIGGELPEARDRHLDEREPGGQVDPLDLGQGLPRLIGDR